VSERKRKKMIGVGKVKQYGNVLDKPINKGKTEVSIYLSSDLALPCYSAPNYISFEWRRLV